MTTKASKHPSLGLLIAAAVVFAFGFLGSGGPVTCGSVTMSPGDRCIQDGNPRSYEEMVRADEQTPLRFGLLALVIVAAAVVVGLTRKSAEPVEQASWEAFFARERALAIEKFLAGVPPEAREEQRRSIEVEFAKVEAAERKKRGFPAVR